MGGNQGTPEAGSFLFSPHGIPYHCYADGTQLPQTLSLDVRTSGRHFLGDGSSSAETTFYQNWAAVHLGRYIPMSWSYRKTLRSHHLTAYQNVVCFWKTRPWLSESLIVGASYSFPPRPFSYNLSLLLGLPKFSHYTNPSVRSLHLFPLSAHISFITDVCLQSDTPTHSYLSNQGWYYLPFEPKPWIDLTHHPQDTRKAFMKTLFCTDNQVVEWTSPGSLLNIYPFSIGLCLPNVFFALVCFLSKSYEVQHCQCSASSAQKHLPTVLRTCLL